MVTRDKYFDLNLCDEEFGSWGSQGIEVACKTWLSGGKVICNHKTWYAHLFRTQGGSKGDFGFPYRHGIKGPNFARKALREIFFNNKWEKQIHPLHWLVEKFWPIPGWSEKDLAKLKGEKFENPIKPKKVLTKGIVYYTDNHLEEHVMKACQKQLEKAELPIVSISHKPIDFGQNMVLPLTRSALAMFRQILAGLERSVADIIFLCEHDILYTPEHFKFTPPDKNTYYYNEHVWFLRLSDGHALRYNARQLSGLCAYRVPLVIHYRERVKVCERVGFSRYIGFEPMNHGRIKWNTMYEADGWNTEAANIDIKHEQNQLRQRWSQSEFRNTKAIKIWEESTIDKIPGWPNLVELLNTKENIKHESKDNPK